MVRVAEGGKRSICLLLKNLENPEWRSEQELGAYGQEA